MSIPNWHWSDKRYRPLPLHEPWKRQFTPEELADWLSRYCDEVTVEPIDRLEGQPGTRLFLDAHGRRHPSL